MIENIMDLLIGTASKEKGRIIQEDKEISYAELLERARTFSVNIANVTQGTMIGIYLPNCIEFMEYFFAVHNAKKKPVFISIMETKYTLKQIIEDADISMIITNEQYLDNAMEASCNVPFNCKILNVNDGMLYSNSKERYLTQYKEDLSDVIALIKTSGTTGKQKFVMLTTAGVLENVKAHIESVKFQDSERTLIMLPMCFGYCFSSQMIAHIYLGADIVIYTGKFECNKLIEIISRWNITNTVVVPSMINVLVMYLRKKNKKITFLKKLLFGGMSISPEILNQLYEFLPNTQIIETYGQTEHSPRISTKIHTKNGKQGSVGKPIRGVELRIYEPVDRIGEICVKSNYIMKGYYGQKELSNETVKDGVLYTGDVGYLDDDNELHIVGRKKNIIIRNGINISPEEIEYYINGVNGVLQSIVIAKKDAVTGETPVAKVVLEEGALAADVKQEIILICRRFLPSYKQPDKIEFVNKIPTTYTGKVMRTWV